MPYRCVVWGIGDGYEKIFNQINFEILKGNIEIVSLVAKKQDIITSSKDGFKVVSKELLEEGEVEFDYLIVASILFYQDIVNEAVKLGILEDKIINGAVMLLPMFDFHRYIRLIESRITILSDDCWGGYVYHWLSMKFYSPLVNINWQEGSPIRIFTTHRMAASFHGGTARNISARLLIFMRGISCCAGSF